MVTMTKTKRITVTAAIALALPLALAACSATGHSSESTPRAGDGIGAKWSSCMRDAGFDVPDASDSEIAAGTFRSTEGQDQEAFSDRARQCSEAVGVRPKGDADTQKYERQYDRVASCIRENGYEDFPEQQPGRLDFTGYPRATEPEFTSTVGTCIEEFAPDTKFQGN